MKEELFPRIVWSTENPCAAGAPSCICSWCRERIEEAAYPRLYNERPGRPTYEAKFHDRCFDELVELQVISLSKLSMIDPRTNQPQTK